MVKEQLEIYRCEVCGNVVEVLNVGGGELVCCKQPMKLLTANTTRLLKARPRHRKNRERLHRQVGSVAHPEDR
jgi:superoxide reductase